MFQDQFNSALAGRGAPGDHRLRRRRRQRRRRRRAERVGRPRAGRLPRLQPLRPRLRRDHPRPRRGARSARNRSGTRTRPTPSRTPSAPPAAASARSTPPQTTRSNAGVPVSVNAGGKQGRGVPDVAGDADPATGYNIVLNGQLLPVGGTSAVAPLWAGLIALINQQLGRRVGFINPKIYALPADSPAFQRHHAGATTGSRPASTPTSATTPRPAGTPAPASARPTGANSPRSSERSPPSDEAATPRASPPDRGGHRIWGKKSPPRVCRIDSAVPYRSNSLYLAQTPQRPHPVRSSAGCDPPAGSGRASPSPSDRAWSACPPPSRGRGIVRLGGWPDAPR